ncbi:MAG: hypothetical protein IJY06_10875 [Oscillospiraceae bacterium]|nr:hypothetical protein [Oscillospiraceae bacterium]
MCALFGYFDCGKKNPHKVLQKLVQALANASEERGSFTFTILDERNNLYFVKGSSPLYLIYFRDFGLYVYASTAGIMHKALKAVSLNHLNYEMIEVQDGEILKISKNGSLSRDAFTPAPDFCFGRYQRSIFGWDEEVPESTDDYAILLEMCGYFGVTPEEVQRLIDLGFSYDEIEMMLWEPEGVEEELTTA